MNVGDKVKHINHLDWGIGVVDAESTVPGKVYVKFKGIWKFPEKICSIENLIKEED